MLDAQIHLRLLFIAVVALHSFVVIWVALRFRARSSGRSNRIWVLIAIHGLVVIVGAAVLPSLTQLGTVLAAMSGLTFLIVGSFVVSVEVPGYLLLSAYDDRAAAELTLVRSALIASLGSFDKLAGLGERVDQSKGFLNEAGLSEVMSAFLSSCKRMKNIDTHSGQLTLSEVTRSINNISNRSKHPFPRLIDVLSLAGLSFLLANFLLFVG